MRDDRPDPEPGAADDGPPSADGPDPSGDPPATDGASAADDPGQGGEPTASADPLDDESGPGGLAFTPDDEATPTRITVAPEGFDDDATAWITVDAGLVIDPSEHA